MKFKKVGDNKFKLVEYVNYGKPTYEWVFEELDDYGDIVSVDHPNNSEIPELLKLSKQDKYDLGLVRDRFNMYGEHIRGWAYIEDGKLPIYFLDASKNRVGKVPLHFHKFLEKHQDKC
jgi:hypothetical protein